MFESRTLESKNAGTKTERGRRMRGVENWPHFRPITPLIAVKCKIGPALLLNTNRNSYTDFQLVPNSMTVALFIFSRCLYCMERKEDRHIPSATKI